MQRMYPKPVLKKFLFNPTVLIQCVCSGLSNKIHSLGLQEHWYVMRGKWLEKRELTLRERTERLEGEGGGGCLAEKDTR